MASSSAGSNSPDVMRDLAMKQEQSTLPVGSARAWQKSLKQNEFLQRVGSALVYRLMKWLRPMPRQLLRSGTASI
jgi:hypothetical protein